MNRRTRRTYLPETCFSDRKPGHRQRCRAINYDYAAPHNRKVTNGFRSQFCSTLSSRLRLATTPFTLR
jgi:hypothetical protein